MKILHITPKSDGYEEVTLVANRINRKNYLSCIAKMDGSEYTLYYTGGFIINDTPQIREVLDSIPKDKQYEFVESFKSDPFVKSYLEEE